MGFKRYNGETNARIEILLKCGVPPAQIARNESMTLRSIERRKKRLEAFGTVDPDPLRVQGHPRSLTIEQEEIVADFLHEYPQAYLDETLAFISDEFDIKIDRSTICRILKRIRLTHKTVEPIHGAQEVDLRVRWMSTITGYRAEQVVFLDETACSGRTANRRFGWSPRGFPCRVRRINIKSKRWSILPALSQDGYIAVDMFQGSYNGDRFKSFVSCHVLPKMNPWPLPRSVIIVDNASTHNHEVDLPTDGSYDGN
jgi:transposase